MSVVNKMLQDLEARQSQTDEINSDYHAPQKKHSKPLVLILFILAIAVIIFALIDRNRLFGAGKNTEVTASVNTQVLPPTVTKRMTVVPKKRLQEQVQSQTTPSLSSKTNSELLDTAIDVALANNVLVNKNLSPNERELATDNLPPEQNVETQNEQIDALSSSELDTQATLEQTSSFSMTDSSQNNNTLSLKQHIAESLNHDNFDLAQSLISELLATEPNNIKARKKLASLLFAQGNYAQSKQLLIQGIELHPAQSDLGLMLARLYVVQKAPSQAMNILTEFYPSTDNQIEYLAYRAALAQKLKKTELAKSDYQTLTNIESTNAKWWLGLAVAMDQLGETHMASQAYHTAISLGQLNVSVNNFMQQRITVLAGTQ